MTRTVAVIAGILGAALVILAGVLSQPAVGVFAQHADEHAGDQTGAPRNAISAQAADGLVRMESLRFT
jgi:hypothetical protein